MPEPKPVLLDLDGTLVDSTFHDALTWQRAFAQHGFAIEAWRTHRAIGMGSDMLVPALAGEEWAKEKRSPVERSTPSSKSPAKVRAAAR